MKLTRRNFLAWAGIAATGAIACDLFDDELRVQSPALIPEDLVKGRDNWYATYDPAAPGGEGILVRVMEGRAKKVRGNPRFPTNQGKQSPASDAILQSLYHPDRIAGPMLRSGPRGSGQYRAIGWEEALNRFNAAVDDRGDGMLLITETQCAGFAQICKAFAEAFGGRHLRYDGMDDSAYGAAVQDTLGTSRMPWHDIEDAETLVSFGSDFLSTWGNPTAYEVGYGKFRGKSHRGRHFHFGSRYSLTAANADKWIPIAPGTEGYAAMALGWAVAATHPESSYVQAVTGEAGPGVLDDFAPDAAAGMLQIPEAVLDGKSIREFFEALAHDYAAHGGLVIGGGGEAGAYSNGKFNASAALMLNYLLGNVGKSGGMQPDAGAPIDSAPSNVPYAALRDWRQAVSEINGGRARLVIVHNADPVYGLPAGVGIREALANENVVVISASPFLDETAAMADLIIPDRTGLEAWGDDAPNPAPGHKVYAVQQPVVNPLADLDPRSFPDILLSSAADLGRGDMMPAASYEELIRSNIDELGADFTETLKNGGWWDDGATAGSSDPPSGLLDSVASMASTPQMQGSGDFQLQPFAHHTLLDGRNAHLPWAQNTPDPLTTVAWQTWVDINYTQGKQMDLREGDVVNITTANGSIQALVYLNPGSPPGIAAVPMGGGRQIGSEYATGRDTRESGNVMSILAVAEVDGSGGLAWSGNRCTITPTGDSMAVSKLEGGYTNREVGEHSVERVFKSVSDSEGGGH